MRPHILAAFWALLLIALGSPTSADAAARRMAIMDLTKGAGSQEYDGLGMALSGMLASDLIQVEQLALVERQRLDDVVGELKLSEGQFIDPKTAQKLGRGLGADLILVGSYSVVGKTFVLDGRIVDVASGEVQGAGSSNGSIDDFVAVEKDLIDQLIQALNIQLGASVKRKLMLQAETESFQALSAYGEGLQRKKEGKEEDAKAAFQRAAQIDPQFAAAKAALSEMQSKVQAHEAALADWKSKLKNDAHKRVLEAFPDESTRPEGFVHDASSLAELTLRLIALEQAGLHCQRAKEMRALLDRVEWKLASPSQQQQAMLMLSISNALQAKEEATALEAYTRSLSPQATPHVPNIRHYHLYTKTAQMWRQGLYSLAVGDQVTMQGVGLKGSLKACLSSEDYLDALEDLSAQLQKSGAADQPTAGGSTLGMAFELELLQLSAQTHGATAALQKRIDALLAKHPVGCAHHEQVLRHIKMITGLAQKHGTSSRIQSTMSQEEITRLLIAATDKESTAFRRDSQACKQAMMSLKGIGSSMKMMLKTASQLPAASRDQMLKSQFDASMPMLAAAKDLGCLTDHPSRFKDAAALRAYLEKTIANLQPAAGAPDMCEMMSAGLDHLPNFDLSHPMMMHGALQMLYSQAQQGCIEL